MVACSPYRAFVTRPTTAGSGPARGWGLAVLDGSFVARYGEIKEDTVDQLRAAPT